MTECHPRKKLPFHSASVYIARLRYLLLLSPDWLATMLVLYETSLGYCLFKLTDSSKLKKGDVWQDFETPEKANALSVFHVHSQYFIPKDWLLLTSTALNLNHCTVSHQLLLLWRTLPLCKRESSGKAWSSSCRMKSRTRGRGRICWLWTTQN